MPVSSGSIPGVAEEALLLAEAAEGSKQSHRGVSQFYAPNACSTAKCKGCLARHLPTHGNNKSLSRLHENGYVPLACHKVLQREYRYERHTLSSDTTSSLSLQGLARHLKCAVQGMARPLKPVIQGMAWSSKAVAHAAINHTYLHSQNMSRTSSSIVCRPGSCAASHNRAGDRGRNSFKLGLP